MQPCAVCGGVVITAAGYCAPCGAYRGDPAALAAAPTSGGPPTGPPYAGPVTGPPYPGPVTGPPYPAAPTAAPPYAALPHSVPPTGPRGRGLAVPLVALSATLVVLVIAIVVVVVVKNSGGSDGTAGDACVVGEWRVTSHREEVPVPGVGAVTFTGSGATVRLRADGSAATDFGSGTVYTGTVNGQAIMLSIGGRLDYHYTAKDGTVSFRDMRSTASAQVSVNGSATGSAQPFTGSDDPATYECAGDSLVERTQLYETRLARVGPG